MSTDVCRSGVINAGCGCLHFLCRKNPVGSLHSPPPQSHLSKHPITNEKKERLAASHAACIKRLLSNQLHALSLADDDQI